MRHLSVALLCLTVLGCASAWRDPIALAPPDEARAVLVAITVERIGTEQSTFGSAVPLGGQRLLTAQHCLPDPGPTPAILLARGLGGPFTVVARGGKLSNAEDWAVVDLPPWMDSQAAQRIDVGVRPHTGEVIYLVGYVTRADMDSGRAPDRPSVVRAIVVDSPEGIGGDDRVVYARTADDDAYHGLSGGAAVRVGDTGYEVFGIYSGLAVRADGTWIDGVHAICRPPRDAITRP